MRRASTPPQDPLLLCRMQGEAGAVQGLVESFTFTDTTAICGMSLWLTRVSLATYQGTSFPEGTTIDIRVYRFVPSWPCGFFAGAGMGL